MEVKIRSILIELSAQLTWKFMKTGNFPFWAKKNGSTGSEPLWAAQEQFWAAQNAEPSRSRAEPSRGNTIGDKSGAWKRVWKAENRCRGLRTSLGLENEFGRLRIVGLHTVPYLTVRRCGHTVTVPSPWALELTSQVTVNGTENNRSVP